MLFSKDYTNFLEVLEISHPCLIVSMTLFVSRRNFLRCQVDFYGMTYSVALWNTQEMIV